MEHTKHIWRAVFILLVLGIMFIGFRHFMIPASYGLTGPYRHDDLVDQMSKPVRHGGPKSCRECHSDEYGTHQGGKHASVSCETCHAPLVTHAVGDEVIAEMASLPSYELCATCHQKLRARPEAFPQVLILPHLVDQGFEESDLEDVGICLECHTPHDPAVE